MTRTQCYFKRMKWISYAPISFLLSANLLTGCGSSTDRAIESDPTTALTVRDLQTNAIVATSFSLKLVGEIKSPEIENIQLQATDIVVEGRYAYIAYNAQGPRQMGAIQLVDIKNSNEPKVLTEYLIKDRDINALAVSKDRIYFTGASQDETEGPAYFARLVLQDEKFESGFKSIPLSGFAGTSIGIRDAEAIVTVGDRSGFYVIDLESFQPIFKRSLYDARAVSVSNDDSIIYFLSGQPGLISKYKDLELAEEFKVGGAQTPEAKSTLQRGKKTLLASLNEYGFSFVCQESGIELAHQDPPEVKNVSRADISTNAAVATMGLVFTAQGAGGLVVYSAKADGGGCAPMAIATIGRVDFGDYASANGVYASGNLVFVASGRAGLKIVSVRRGFPSIGLEDFELEGLDLESLSLQ